MFQNSRRSYNLTWQSRYKNISSARTLYAYFLVQALSGHGCFNVYLKRFKKRYDESCRYCGSLVDNAEHTLLSVPGGSWKERLAVGQWAHISLLTRWSLSCSSLNKYGCLSSHSSPKCSSAGGALVRERGMFRPFVFQVH